MENTEIDVNLLIRAASQPGIRKIAKRRAMAMDIITAGSHDGAQSLIEDIQDDPALYPYTIQQLECFILTISKKGK